MLTRGHKRISRKATCVLVAKILLISTFFSPLAIPPPVHAEAVKTNYSLFRAPPPIIEPKSVSATVDGEITSAVYVPPPVRASLYQGMSDVRTTSSVAVGPSSGDTNSDKLFIYNKESGNNPKKVNTSSGACGLGQALPCSKLLEVCPDLDYGCEDGWFTAVYMTARYHSWANAKAFWMTHGAPCNNDVGWCGWW